jgi:hypothetical protein
VARGTLFTYGRDPLARLSSIDVRAVDATSPPVPRRTFEYDHLDREVQRSRGTSQWLTTWTSGEGTTSQPNGDQVSVLVDGRGRVASRGFSNGAGSVPGHSRISFSYNGLDDLMQAVESGEGTVTTEYLHADPRGLLTRIERAGSPAIVYGRRVARSSR